MGGDRSGRIGSSISARRTRRKPSTREIKAATKEPRLKDDAMRTMVGKEKTGNSNSYMPKNSRGRPVGLRLGHKQLELEVGPWKLSGSNTKDPSTETNKRPLHGCEPVPKRDPGFAAPLCLAKIHLSSPSWKATTPLWVLRGDTINLAAVPTNWKLLSFDTTCKFYLRYSQRHRQPGPLHRKVSRSNRQQSSGAQQPDDARHTRHEKPGHAIDMAKKGGSENTGKKAQGQARKAEAAAQKSAAAEADKEAAEATKWDKGAKSGAKK